MLGEYLLAAGEVTEARAVLDRALRDYDFAPAPSRRRNARWARQARRLLKQAEKNGRPNP
jgi:ribosomal protein S21